MTEHLLIEHVSGYELFELKGYETLAKASYSEYTTLTQIVNHISSLPITDSSEAVNSIQLLGNSEIPETLRNFLELNGVKTLHCDKSLQAALKALGIEQKSSPNIIRGVKGNLTKFTKTADQRVKEKAADRQLLMSVALAFARENIKYDLEREDSLVISVGNEIEQLENEISSLNGKINKLVKWYLPSTEKGEIRHQFTSETRHQFTSETLSELLAQKEISEMEAVISKGYFEMLNEKEKLLADLEEYLSKKLKALAPNLREILGDRLCLKLIQKAGGLVNLCLCPASTLQLFGAERALFRSLKMKTKTPKYGLLYKLGYVYRLDGLKENYGRMCRYIAAKCSLAARIDCFDEDRTGEYGRELRKLIDRKIKSYKSKKVVVETSAEILKRVHQKLKEREI